MTAKCANPACQEPFLYFRSGKIFLIEIPSTMSARQGGRGEPEYFWLCGECARSLQVAVNTLGSVTVSQIDSHGTPVPVSSSRLSRPVAPSSL